jgi:ABC-type antimicrobial peptide transport system permease subunit
MLAAMNWETYTWLGWAMVYAVVGALVGIGLVVLAASVMPRLLDRLTPHLDEGKEIARGNQAVALYFGLVVGACIIGLSLVVAAAVLGGIIAALHGV